jgi:uncharacterized surface protein with fasciclin (FAS1) repeats
MSMNRFSMMPALALLTLPAAALGQAPATTGKPVPTDQRNVPTDQRKMGDGSVPSGAAAGEAVACCFAPQRAGQPESSLFERLSAAGNFNTFLSLLETAGIQDDSFRKLAGGRPYTLLAPNDAAFAALPKGSLAALKRDPQRLRSFLLGHMLQGSIKVEDMFDATQVESRKDFKTAQGRVLGFQCNGRHSGMHNPTIDGRARIGTFQDVMISGGIVHEIGAVLAIE